MHTVMTKSLKIVIFVLFTSNAFAVPTLDSLNKQVDFVSDPIDLSPEGFDFIHREFALIISGMIYEHDLKGIIRETVLHERLPKIRSYLTSLKKIARPAFEKWEDKHKLPFLLNAYTANMLLVIGETTDKERKQDLMIKPALITLFDQKYSFDEFLMKEITARYTDHRIIFALPCFADDCPDFRNRSMNYRSLDSMLDVSTTRYAQNPEKMKIDLSKKKIVLPAYFKSHFGTSKQANAASEAEKFLQPFVTEKALALLKAGALTVTFE